MVRNNLRLLKWHAFFDGFRPYEAIAVLYFLQVSGSFTRSLAVFSIASITTCLFEVPTGVLSDRIGRRRTFILGAVASLFAILFYSFASSFFTLVCGAFFIGLSWAFLSGNHDALLFDTLKEVGEIDAFSEKHGKIHALFQVGLGLSALVAVFIPFISLQAIMAFSILPRCICFLIATRIVEPASHNKKISENSYSHIGEALKAFWSNAKLQKLSLAYILNNAVEEAHYQFKPAFIASVLPSWALGISRSLDNVGIFLGHRWAGRLTRRREIYKGLFFQQIASRVVLVLSTVFPTVLSPFLLNINSFFFGISETGSQSLMQREFTDGQRATMGSLNSLVGSLLFALLTFATGLIADQLGPVKTMMLLGLVSVPAIFLYANLYGIHGGKRITRKAV